MDKTEDKIKDKAYALNQMILKDEAVLEFQRYESIVKNSKELMDLEKNYKELQKRIVQEKSFKEDCDDLIKEYKKVKETFENHPIVVNYNASKEEVNEMLQNICFMINGQL